MKNKQSPINKLESISNHDFIKPKNSAFPVDFSLAENESKRLIYFKQKKIIQSEKKIDSLEDNAENLNPNMKLSDLLKKYQKKNKKEPIETDFSSLNRLKQNENYELCFEESFSEDSIRKIDFEKEEKSIDHADSYIRKNSNCININSEISNAFENDKIRNSNKADFCANSGGMEIEIDYNFQSSTLRNSKNFPLKASLKKESIGN
jgi:hypothetical protein